MTCFRGSLVNLALWKILKKATFEIFRKSQIDGGSDVEFDADYEYTKKSR